MNNLRLNKMSSILFVSLFSLTLNAQSAAKNTTPSSTPDSIKKQIKLDKLNHFSYGVNFTQYGGDFGMSLDLVSPYFDVSDDNMGDELGAFRLLGGANIMHGELPNEINTSTFGYYTIRFGFIDKKTILKDKIALLFEEGGYLVLPNTKTSSETARFGLYILPGVEFYSSSRTSILFQIGADVGQSCIANKLAGQPFYYVDTSNNKGGVGIIISGGLRRYF